jgi:hypothetical protein
MERIKGHPEANFVALDLTLKSMRLSAVQIIADFRLAARSIVGKYRPGETGSANAVFWLNLPVIGVARAILAELCGGPTCDAGPRHLNPHRSPEPTRDAACLT